MNFMKVARIFSFVEGKQQNHTVSEVHPPGVSSSPDKCKRQSAYLACSPNGWMFFLVIVTS